MDVIRSARLVLRTWDTADAQAFWELNQDPRVTAFLPAPPTMAQAVDFVAAQQALFDASGACYFALALADSGELVGFTGLKRHDAGLPIAPCTDIGWRLAAPHCGKGYAIEAARACIGFGFGDVRLDEIVSFTVAANLRSRAVMEKLGMREDAGGAFAHPALAPGHPLSRHVLYRLAAGRDFTVVGSADRACDQSERRGNPGDA